MKDSTFLQWIHDRIYYVYEKEKIDQNIDFLIKLREIIEKTKEGENGKKANSIH